MPIELRQDFVGQCYPSVSMDHARPEPCWEPDRGLERDVDIELDLTGNRRESAVWREPEPEPCCESGAVPEPECELEPGLGTGLSSWNP